MAPRLELTEEQRINQITEGLYRWTIDTVNTAIKDAATHGGLKQPILGTGRAPLLAPPKAKKAIQDQITLGQIRMLEFFVAEEYEIKGETSEDFRAGMEAGINAVKNFMEQRRDLMSGNKS